MKARITCVGIERKPNSVDRYSLIIEADVAPSSPGKKYENISEDLEEMSEELIGKDVLITPL